MQIEQKYLDMLACPKTKAKLVLDGNRLVSVDQDSRLCYPIVDGIPVLLVEKGQKLEKDEWSEIMEKQNSK